MPHFTNLGDLIRRDRDLSKVAIIDLGGEQVPREFSYARLDAMANGVARALSSAALHAAIALPSSRPIAPSISPPISASCARAWLRCR